MTEANLDPKALEWARVAIAEVFGGDDEPFRQQFEAAAVDAIRAYLRALPAPDGETGCEYCVDGLQADGETPCPCCTPELSALQAENEKLRREREAISAAIGSVRYMDPPDGGDVSLAEQVARMGEALRAAEARLASLSAPVGEPDAWLGEGDGFKSFTRKQKIAKKWQASAIKVTPVYTAPPSPAPQGMEQAVEVAKIAYPYMKDDFGYRAIIEAALPYLASLSREGSTHRQCPTCHGDGNDITGVYDHCQNCDGTGEVPAAPSEEGR